ncbi:YybH family protein [Spirillospora sp. NPDC048911]|uniref:YybH family protein n=1 Tax=Spirillospora sp. NPDC048911 TaxID=3364527 RepID=UPI003719F2B4
MTAAEDQIRALIERWAQAVQSGDMDGVLADHAKDIVMFDVPPPFEGVHGIEAYRETWPPFFEWQAAGAAFEIESLEVTAGADVAFAYALLRCGTAEELAANPATRLRLTLGLRNEDGRWIVTHEHHSFPSTDQSSTEEVRALHDTWFTASEAKDLDGLMAVIADDVVSYEHDAPLQYTGADAVREVCAAGLAASGDAALRWEVPDLKILVRADLAIAWGLNHVHLDPGGDSWSRGTRVFQRRDGAWTMIHQHLSYPYDPATGQAKRDLQPK